MKHSPADIIQQLLVLHGIGNAANEEGFWPIYVNFRPDSPSRLLVVSDTGGVLKSREMRSGKTYDSPGIQILLRGESTEEALSYEKVHAIFSWCDTVRNAEVLLDSSVYLVKHLRKTSTVLQLGKEERTLRPMMTFNLLAEIGVVL